MAYAPYTTNVIGLPKTSVIGVYGPASPNLTWPVSGTIGSISCNGACKCQVYAAGGALLASFDSTLTNNSGSPTGAPAAPTPSNPWTVALALDYTEGQPTVVQQTPSSIVFTLAA